MVIKYLFSVFLGLLALFTMPVNATEYERLLQIVVDDTGALQDEEDPKNYTSARQALNNYLSSVASKYGRETLVVVTSQYGSRNVWSGEARMIRRNAQNAGLQAFLKSDWGGCSDLIGIFKLLNDNIYLYPAQNHEVVFFSSLVHTGADCSNKPSQGGAIKLPEEFLTELEKFHGIHKPELSFHWVYDNGNSLIRQQLVKYSQEKSVRFPIKVESETRSARF